MKTCILLSACINPNGMSFTQLQDSTERLHQYLDALNYYLGKTSVPIVFVENSGYDISGYFVKEIETGRLEVLTFDGNNYDKQKGKGFGEALILKYAFEHSRIIRQVDYVVKITGRLIVNNIKAILFESQLFKNELIISYLCQGFLDSRVFVASTSFYRNLFLSNIDKIDDCVGYYLESLLLDCKEQADWRPFYTLLPQVEGVSGTYGTKIESQSIFSKEYWRKLKLNWKEYLGR